MARQPTREDGLFVGRSLDRGFSTGEIAVQLTIRGFSPGQAKSFIDACRNKLVALTTGTARAADASQSKRFHDGLLTIGLGVLGGSATFLYLPDHPILYPIALCPILIGMLMVVRSLK